MYKRKLLNRNIYMCVYLFVYMKYYLVKLFIYIYRSKMFFIRILLPFKALLNLLKIFVNRQKQYLCRTEIKISFILRYFRLK